MEIKSISQKIFRTSPNKSENRSESTHTNPFGVNFKGNIINADVFDKSEKSSISFKGAEIAAKAATNGKLYWSAIVGALNTNVDEAMSKMLNPVKAFGRTIKENAHSIKTNAIQMKDKAVNACKDFVSTSWRTNIESRLINYRKLGIVPVPVLKDMFVERIAARRVV